MIELFAEIEPQVFVSLSLFGRLFNVKQYRRTYLIIKVRIQDLEMLDQSAFRKVQSLAVVADVVHSQDLSRTVF